MRTLLLFILLLYSLLNYGQYQFTGELPENYANETIFLSHITNYRKSSRVYLDQIISKATTDSLGRFRFEEDNLSTKNNLYRIHIDDCNYIETSASHFLGECNYTQSIVFIAKNTDTITLPLLQTNQALCEINSSNTASSLILEIDALKEEMIFDFLEYPSKANESLNFKKWFSRFQEFGLTSNEPLAELYIYDFLSDRASETHSFYLDDIQHNEYYSNLLNRLKTKYPNAAFTQQFRREITADKVVPNTITMNSFFSDYSLYVLLAVLIIISSVLFYRRKEQKRKMSYLETLTGQEKTIVEKIAEGKSNKEIAAELFISLSTVKTHINNLYKKLGVTSREDLKSLL